MEIKWPKIPRLENESWHITEKIDGTNGCIRIEDVNKDEACVYAYSRNRLLSIKDDNFGFAAWVFANADELSKLGEGWHFGEWWGKGIQRGYGLDHKRFSLFEPWKCQAIPAIVHVVPTIPGDANSALEQLKSTGSLAAPGYMQPEGLILHSKQHRGLRYKVIIKSEHKKR